MLNFIDRLLDKIFGILGFLFFTQGPEFIQQYTQRLGGHVAEAELQVKKINEMASLTSKTAGELIHKFLSNTDTDFVNHGLFLQGLIERFEILNDALTNITQAPTLLKPFYFLSYAHYEIVQETAAYFQPGISFSLEGILYGLAGMLLGIAIYRLIKEIIKLPWLLILSLFSRKSPSNLQH